MDVKSAADRSKNMAAIKGRDTRPEIALRQHLWNSGVRFFTSRGWQTLSGKKLPGNPDLVFPSARLVIFVDGCFWHGCPLHHQAPVQNHGFWARKLQYTQTRDRTVHQELTNQGWTVIRVWEHDLSKKTIPLAGKKILGLVNERRNDGSGRTERQILGFNQEEQQNTLQN